MYLENKILGHVRRTSRICCQQWSAASSGSTARYDGRFRQIYQLAVCVSVIYSNFALYIYYCQESFWLFSSIIRYREKASKDAEDILGRSQQLLKQAGLQGLTIVEEDVKLFCKECQNLRLIRGYPMYEEINSVPVEILQELGESGFDKFLVII